MKRHLTEGEIALAASIFGDAIDYAPVTVNRRRWFPFQPANVVMAPDGHIWVNPRGALWSEDYAGEHLSIQALFLHELTHVLQAQERGRFYLLLMRHPFCRYRYSGAPRAGHFAAMASSSRPKSSATFSCCAAASRPTGAPPLWVLEQILPFGGRSA